MVVGGGHQMDETRLITPRCKIVLQLKIYLFVLTTFKTDFDQTFQGYSNALLALTTFSEGKHTSN